MLLSPFINKIGVEDREPITHLGPLVAKSSPVLLNSKGNLNYYVSLQTDSALSPSSDTLQYLSRLYQGSGMLRITAYALTSLFDGSTRAPVNSVHS